jgi:hypothetical protein
MIEAGASEARLEREHRAVVIPDLPILPAEELEAILREAGVSYPAFLDLLAETPTKPGSSRPFPTGARRPHRVGDSG